MEKETTSVKLNEQSLSDDVILNTFCPSVGWSEEKLFWYVQVGDTKIAMNYKENADLIAMIVECDNHYKKY